VRARGREGATVYRRLYDLVFNVRRERPDDLGWAWWREGVAACGRFGVWARPCIAGCMIWYSMSGRERPDEVRVAACGRDRRDRRAGKRV
jgi:hypothetical protein